MWKYIIFGPRESDKLDLADRYVSIGPYTIQHRVVYGAPVDALAAEVIELLRQVPGVVVHIEHTGVRSGYGHGRETLRLLNADGSLIYEVSHIDHCDGPGYACSYSHGPWEKYGQYNGSAEPDPDIASAIMALERLRAKVQW